MFYPPLIRGFTGGLAGGSAAVVAHGAERDAHEARSAVDLMRHDIERLLMITEALWTILKRDRGYQDEDLEQVITDIDLRDGKLDGRVAPGAPLACPWCGHVVGKRRPFCFYCGKPIAPAPFER